MDLTNLARLCSWISERVEEALPGRFWWITVVAGVLALVGLGLMLFGLRLVRGLCILLGPPAGAVIGLVLAPLLGTSPILSVAVGAGAGFLLGLVLYRVMIVVLAVEMILVLLTLSLGWGLHAQVDWEALTNLEPKIEAGRIDPFQNAGKSPWQIWRERATQEYQSLTARYPWLPAATVATALVLAIVAAVGGVWLWRWATLLISLFFGLQLLLVGGGVFLLRAAPEAFNQAFSRPAAFLFGLAFLTFLCALAQYRLNRRPTYGSPAGSPTGRGGWAL